MIDFDGDVFNSLLDNAKIRVFFISFAFLLCPIDLVHADGVAGVEIYFDESQERVARFKRFKFARETPRGDSIHPTVWP